MGTKLQPRDVFTPAAPVQSRMFATRHHEHLQDRVEAGLDELGRQVLLFGPTGVGKTSLVSYLCDARKLRFVRVECGQPFDAMMREALGVVVGEQEIERIQKESDEREIGVTLWGLLTGKAKFAAGREVKFAKYPVSLATTVAESFRILGCRVLFLDNFENLMTKDHYGDTAAEIVQLMKSLSDRSAATGKTTAKVVVAGIPSASGELVELDEAAERRIKQIEVPKMPAGELDEILKNGERELGISFEGFCRERILTYSDGFPYYTHLHALHTSRRALGDGRKHVTLEDFDMSLDEIMADCALSLRRDYERAVETTGEIQTRKSILEAMASMNDTEVTFRAIREAFLKLHPKYQDAKNLNFLSYAVKPLKEDYGILIDKGKPKSTHNTYSFHNPLMRAYVRLKMLQEKQTQMSL